MSGQLHVSILANANSLTKLKVRNILRLGTQYVNISKTSQIQSTAL